MLCLGSAYLIYCLQSLTLFQEEEEENFLFALQTCLLLLLITLIFPPGHQAPCCGKLYTCRLCHDNKEDHQLDRFKVKEVQCINCEKIQHVRFYHISILFIFKLFLLRWFKNFNQEYCQVRQLKISIIFDLNVSKLIEIKLHIL